jgi:hypothetical protein
MTDDGMMAAVSFRVATDGFRVRRGGYGYGGDGGNQVDGVVGEAVGMR